jgi:4-amino-4-deoxy-L-arabinose transferase-like glycosyltransferase
MGDVVGGRLELGARPDELAGAAGQSTTEMTRTQSPSRSWSRFQLRPRTSRLQFWRSPDDQPRWARPALLVVAALAALAYAWGLNGDTLETFYAGAVRSMSQNWHNFFFGSFDPWGTVTVDKLPGAFWLQALSVRLFGFHIWAFVLPQVVEGTLAVLVLYRVVRRVAGAGAGLIAAVALAVTPVTILLNRGNISDSLLILLLVLAADAATGAYMSGRLRPLVLAGVWVGLAFQAKMLQAWLVLPALYAAYLMAAPALSLARRYGHIAVSLVVALAVSVSWMGVVALVPAHDRPYVDGSCNNSVFSQVFLYNGADRLNGKVLEQPGCSPAPATTIASAVGGAPTVALDKGPARYLAGALGRDAAWLFVPAMVALVGILVARRRRPRTDPWRAAGVLWGFWMILTWAFFADSHFLNAYYLAALAPPMAALCALGLALGWRIWRDNPESRVVPVVFGAAVLGGVAEALSLVPRSAGMWPLVLATTILLTGCAAACLAVCLFRTRSKQASKPQSTWAARAALASGTAALLIGSAWASGTAVAGRLGPFDSPYQSQALTTSEHAGWQHQVATWPALAAHAATVPVGRSIQTVETSAQASGDVLATGREYLPVGGFSGQVPSTPLTKFVEDVRDGRVNQVLVAVRPASRNPDMRWVLGHCSPARTPAAPAPSPTPPVTVIDGRSYRTYVCVPSDADAATPVTGAPN